MWKCQETLNKAAVRPSALVPCLISHPRLSHPLPQGRAQRRQRRVDEAQECVGGLQHLEHSVFRFWGLEGVAEEGAHLPQGLSLGVVLGGQGLDAGEAFGEVGRRQDGRGRFDKVECPLFPPVPYLRPFIKETALNNNQISPTAINSSMGRKKWARKFVFGLPPLNRVTTTPPHAK